MKSLTVDLADRSYQIAVGPGLLNRADILAGVLERPSVVVVTNEVVGPLYLSPLCQSLTSVGVQVHSVVLPDGEKYKEWTTLNQIFEALLRNRCERSTTLLALGGGVIGDMAGFAAACYQRGMPFVQLPTTLLSQVDSAVGGKTAINHPLGKNMIGAFYQPKLVISDTSTLETLPERQLRSGLAEVIKYGLIRDADFFCWLEDHMDLLLKRDQDALSHAILESCRHKAAVVAADERESGERALLNLGHTFGHAIETGMGYGVWLHGEAVAVGTMMAAESSHSQGLIDRSTVKRTENLFRRAGLPVTGPTMASGRYLELMAHDKKVVAGKMKLILLRDIGKAFISDACPESAVLAAIEACSA